LDISEDDGENHVHYEIANNTKEIRNFLKKFKSATSIHVLMEATRAYHVVLFMISLELGFPVSVVNPLIIKRHSQMRMMRVKTDISDSRIIAEYGCDQKPPLSKLPPQEQRYILSKFKAVYRLQDMYLMLSNLIHAMEISVEDKFQMKNGGMPAENKIT